MDGGGSEDGNTHWSDRVRKSGELWEVAFNKARTFIMWMAQ